MRRIEQNKIWKSLGRKSFEDVHLILWFKLYFWDRRLWEGLYHSKHSKVTHVPSHQAHSKKNGNKISKEISFLTKDNKFHTLDFSIVSNFWDSLFFFFLMLVFFQANKVSIFFQGSKRRCKYPMDLNHDPFFGSLNIFRFIILFTFHETFQWRQLTTGWRKCEFRMISKHHQCYI
jgi:hypothetical protein